MFSHDYHAYEIPTVRTLALIEVFIFQCNGKLSWFWTSE